jgi:uncharacterized protein (DUF1015 family)
MSKTKAFKALVYNPEKIEDFNQVVCPPYDVIAPAAQEAYRERSLYNLIHVLLPDGSAEEDKYRRADTIFRSWLKEGVLARDKKPAIYFYSQQYIMRGEKKTRLGFISLLRLGDEKGSAVFGHENTHLEAKQDRFRLVEQVKANLSPIFVIFLDKKRIIQRLFHNHIWGKQPFIEVSDEEKTVHKVWRIDDPEVLDMVESSMESENMFIADGHHRYEVSCAYRNLMREKSGPGFSGEEGFNYCMSYFTNTDPRGLSISPIHRLFTLKKELDLADFITRSGEYFDVDQVKDKTRFFFLLEKAGCSEHLIGAYKDGKYFLLRLKNIKILDKLINDKPKEYRTLDVAILNYLVLKNILGFDLDNLPEVKYDPDAEYFIKEVDKDPLKIAFFLNPVKIEQIINVALGGNKMPPKSTYFYPKVLSGITINKLEEGKV